jgi:type II secretory pathway pseudopilin PulG
MLVVIGIIAILAALLLPAVMSAISRARNTAIALEINQINSAIESYRIEKGDYPPNFRNVEVVRRHVAKCYPRIDQNYFIGFMKTVFPTDSNGNPTNPTPPSGGSPGNIMIDEAESVVFWLSFTDKNPQYPFLKLKAIKANLPAALQTVVNGLVEDPKAYYDFDQTRLAQTVATTAGLDVPSFTAKYCKDTFYIYIDSRAYDNSYYDAWDVCRFAASDTPSMDTYAYADDTQTGVRPYWSTTISPNPIASGRPIRDKFKPMNATSFQIICAGQDGDFGTVLGQGGDVDAKQFNTGLNYQQADKDNITNFSNGRTLGDSIP